MKGRESPIHDPFKKNGKYTPLVRLPTHVLSKTMLESLYNMILESYKNAESYTTATKASSFDWSETTSMQETDMYWIPKKGSPILVSKMPTHHLFYATRLVYNQLVQEELRIGNHKYDIKSFCELSTTMPKKLRILMFHLGKPERMDELEEWMLEELILIQRNVRTHL